jgi:hypothetical protein
LQASISTQMAVMRWPAPKGFTFPEKLDGDPTGNIVIHPDRPSGTKSADRKRSFTAQEWQRIQDGKNVTGREIRLYCWGIARYTDVFNRRHWARYCFIYGGLFSQNDGKGNAGRAAMYHRHNDTSDSPDPTLRKPERNQHGLDDYGHLLHHTAD